MSVFIVFSKSLYIYCLSTARAGKDLSDFMYYLFFNMEQVKLINGGVPLGNLLVLGQVSTFAISTPLLLYRNATMTDQSMAPQGRDTKQRQPQNSKNQNAVLCLGQDFWGTQVLST